MRPVGLAYVGYVAWSDVELLDVFPERFVHVRLTRVVGRSWRPALVYPVTLMSLLSRTWW